jgi:hypothetical protein
LVNVISGTANANVTAIYRQGDYLPFNNQFNATISQRIVNQTITIGMVDNVSTPTIQALVQFTGASSSAISFITSSSSAAADTQTTALTLNGLNTATATNYQITLTNNRACLFVGGVLAATHELHLPGSYDNLQMMCKVVNAAAVTATTISLDYILFYNTDQLDITNNFSGEPLPVLTIPSDGTKATYSAAAVGIVAVATPTDVFTITGSATKTVRILRIGISGTQTTAGIVNCILLKRSTANSAGTSTTMTNVQHDSMDVAGTAIVRAYTANPTIGTLVGNIRAIKLPVLGAASVAGSDYQEFYFGDLPEKAPILRGIGEVISVNFNSVTITGNNFDFYIEWTEE